ncbi:MAG: hypothetical protein JRJ54_16000 [Deltaproteobacteria bacterium]|nr:hypothetical protein [Deltaproteobacteria bacterium]
MGFFRTKQLPLLNNTGLSILEVLIALSIMSIGVLGVGIMQFWTVKNNTTGNVFTQANMLAQAQMEFLKNQDINATPTSPLDAGSYTDPNNPMDEFGNPGGIYNRSWTITEYGSFSRQVVVTVSWTRPGGAKSVVVSSITRGNGI